MAHTAVPLLARLAVLIVALAGLARPALADGGMDLHGVGIDNSPGHLTSSLHLSLGPLSRRGIEVGTLLSAEPGRERLYAFVDLQDRLPLPVRRVLRHADGGITLERAGSAPIGSMGSMPSASPAPEGRSALRASLGSMLRWQVRGGTQMAIKLRAGRIGLQLTTPLTF
jgi:hypothetical protein